MPFSYDIITLNTNGLRNNTNRYKLFNQIKRKTPSIVALQETHSTAKDEKNWPDVLGGGSMWFSHGSSGARGVATFISKSLDFQLIFTQCDSDGRVLILVVDLDGIRLCIANIYAPNISFYNTDKIAHEKFFENLNNQLDTIKTQYNFTDLILLGDFNMILDRQLDAAGGNPTLYPRSVASLNDIINAQNLIDIFRELNPEKNMFTYSPGGPNVRNIYRRLDYIFIPDTWLSDAMTTKFTPAIHSDHRIVQLEMRKSKNIIKNSGLWRHNDQLNNNTEYLNEVKNGFQPGVPKLGPWKTHALYGNSSNLKSKYIAETSQFVWRKKGMNIRNGPKSNWLDMKLNYKLTLLIPRLLLVMLMQRQFMIQY